ncbi:MAG: response regulator transcription factor [bacterium]|nr:response regulator transcription factor [Candidatus Sumerlaeota bacterium]
MARNQTVLVVEDERAIAELVALHLREHGYEAVITGEGLPVFRLVEQHKPSLIILDIMLPDLDGIEILKRLRSSAQTRSLPVILLTARAEEGDRIMGLESGADDYVTKPFSPRELMLRADKLIQSRQPDRGMGSPVVFGQLEVDEARFNVTVAGRPIDISATEMRLMTELMRLRGRVLSRSQILENAWGYMPNVTERTIDTHIKRLRRKLGKAARYIETVRGVGYRWLEEPPTDTPGC